MCGILLVFLIFVATTSPALSTSAPSLSTTCDKPGFSKCICGEVEYYGKIQYVLNCTDIGFNDTLILQHLPKETQVLIFVGNNIPKLPKNIFGTSSNNTKLRIVDLTNNKIKEILGQTFHRVPMVERLILNHNDISISLDEHHPRVFSNFQNLLELHLTNAFADDTPDDLAADLHDIFDTSGLTKLRKLHLEQNEIKKFKDPKIFCELNSLMDLHLGDNKLQHINFKFDCLRQLRYIDLEGNDISSFKPEELAALDELSDHENGITIDVSNNPLVCGPKIKHFYNWLKTTKVQVRNKSRLRCRHECIKEYESFLLTDQVSSQSLVLNRPERQMLAAEPTKSSGYESFLTVALLATICLLIYTNREPLKSKSQTVFRVLSQKVHYTNIGKQEVQEMDV